MTRWRIVLPLVLLAVNLPILVRSWPVIVGDADVWAPVLGQLLLVLGGGAVLAGGVAYAMYRHRTAR